MRPRIPILLGALLCGPAAAQAPRPPQPPAPPPAAAEVERMREAPRRAFYLKPETEQAARQSDAKMEAVQRQMDERVRRVTRSICAGCESGAPPRRRGAGPRERELAPADPAQARMD